MLATGAGAALVAKPCSTRQRRSSLVVRAGAYDAELVETAVSGAHPGEPPRALVTRRDSGMRLRVIPPAAAPTGSAEQDREQGQGHSW